MITIMMNLPKLVVGFMVVDCDIEFFTKIILFQERTKDFQIIDLIPWYNFSKNNQFLYDC